jgi:hypothetical protein
MKDGIEIHLTNGKVVRSGHKYERLVDELSERSKLPDFIVLQKTGMIIPSASILYVKKEKK